MITGTAFQLSKEFPIDSRSEQPEATTLSVGQQALRTISDSSTSSPESPPRTVLGLSMPGSSPSLSATAVLRTMTHPDGSFWKGRMREGTIWEGQGSFVREDGSCEIGCWQKGKRIGYFTVMHADGTSWKGSFKKGELWNGEGTWIHQMGARVTGSWKQGRLVGPFTTTLVNGEVWECKEGIDLKDYHAIFVRTDGACAHGTCMDGLLVGLCTITSPDGRIWPNEFWSPYPTGEPSPLNYDGCSRMTKPWFGFGNKDFAPYIDSEAASRLRKPFEGTYQKGSPSQGQGTWTSPEGVEETGHWVEGQRDGFFAITYPDGAHWRGLYKQNRPFVGLGTLRFEDGTHQIGHWQNGKLTGFATIIYPDGTRWNGRIFKKPWQGYGTWIDGRGTAFTGAWTRGHLEGESEVVHSDGTAWKGVCKRGLPYHGSGVWSYDDHHQVVGDWQHGKVIATVTTGLWKGKHYSRFHVGEVERLEHPNGSSMVRLYENGCLVRSRTTNPDGSYYYEAYEGGRLIHRLGTCIAEDGTQTVWKFHDLCSITYPDGSSIDQDEISGGISAIRRDGTGQGMIVDHPLLPEGYRLLGQLNEGKIVGKFLLMSELGDPWAWEGESVPQPETLSSSREHLIFAPEPTWPENPNFLLTRSDGVVVKGEFSQKLLDGPVAVTTPPEALKEFGRDIPSSSFPNHTISYKGIFRSGRPWDGQGSWVDRENGTFISTYCGEEEEGRWVAGDLDGEACIIHEPQPYDFDDEQKDMQAVSRGLFRGGQFRGGIQLFRGLFGEWISLSSRARSDICEVFYLDGAIWEGELFREPYVWGMKRPLPLFPKAILESKWYLGIPFEGKGTLRIPGVVAFTGEVRDSRYVGPCVFNFPDGTCFKASQWKEGLPVDGEGILEVDEERYEEEYDAFARYKGKFVAREFRGRFVMAGGYFEGLIRDGVPWLGVGKKEQRKKAALIWEEGIWIEGQFYPCCSFTTRVLKEPTSSLNIVSSSSPSTAEVLFKTMANPDGTFWEGEMRNGAIWEGQGTYLNEGGSRETGCWRKGERDGLFTITRDDGSLWNGSFKKGLPWTGQGTLIFSRGARVEASWMQGQPISSFTATLPSGEVWLFEKGGNSSGGQSLISSSSSTGD